MGLDSKLRLLEEPPPPGRNHLEHGNLPQHNMSDDEKEKTLMKILQIDKEIETDSKVGEVPDSVNDPNADAVDTAQSCGVYSRCSSQYGPSSVQEPSLQHGPSSVQEPTLQHRPNSAQSSLQYGPNSVQELSLQHGHTLVQSSLQYGPNSTQPSLQPESSLVQSSLKFGANSDQTSLQYGPPSDNSGLTTSLPSPPASSLPSTTQDKSKEMDKASVNDQGPIIFSAAQQELVTESNELPEGQLVS